MKVACPSCNASLTIDDKKIPPGGARIKCPTCQNVFPVKPGAAAPASSAVPLPGISAPKAQPTSWEDEPTRAVPQDQVALPGAARPSSASAAVPLPGISAPKAQPTSWEDEPTRAVPQDQVALPGAARPSSASGAVPRPGISAPKAQPTSWDDEPTRAVPHDAAALAAATRPPAPSGGAVSLPSLSAAKPQPTNWNDEPTRAAALEPTPMAGAEVSIPLPGASATTAAPAIPGASRGVAPPSNVPAARPTTKPTAAVPLPGISAARPAAVGLNDDEATRVGDAIPGGSAGLDLDFAAPSAAAATGGRSATASIPLPGAVAPGVGARPGAGGLTAGAIPLPGSAASFAATFAPPPSSASIPLPGGADPFEADFGAAPPSASIPLPGGADPFEADFGSPPASPGIPLPGRAGPAPSGGGVPLPGRAPPASSGGGIPLPGRANPFEADFAPPPASPGIPLPGAAAAQAADAEDIPFADDFGSAPSAPDDGAAAFDFPQAPPGGGSAPGAGAFDLSFDAPPPPVSGGLSYEAPPDPVPDGLSFDAPPDPAPVSGGFSFEAPPDPAPASGGFSFEAPASGAPADDLSFDFSAPASGGAPSFGGPAPQADAGGNDLEFDPTSTPKRSDDLEADLSAPLPPTQSQPAGPSDGLEMLSFIDHTAKDAGAPQAPVQTRRFHIKRRSGKVFGPFEDTVIVKMLEEAQLLGNEEVSLDAESWQPIGSEPMFQSIIAKLMEVPSRSTTQMGMPAIEEQPKGPSMEKLKQLYEGRMAAVAVVESKAPVPFKKRVPYIIGGVLAAAFLGVGVFAEVATPYGFFFLKKLFPAKVKPDTREFGYLAQARAGLQKDTYRSLVSARDLAAQALAVKEYPEARAIWNQAVYALNRRYAASAPADVQLANDELRNIELLGEKHPELLKARAASALVAGDADGALAVVGDALAREENHEDLEFFFLRAEAFLAKKAIGQARSEYEQILKKSPRSARALHALGTISRQQNELTEAIARYEAAVEADPDHVASGVELADLLLVAQKDQAKGEPRLTPLLSKEKKAEMAPTELGKALALQAELQVLDSKLQEALPLFEEALKADPKNAFAQGRLARVLATLNQPEKAYPHYRDAAATTPESLEYTAGYLSTLVLLGKMDEATKAVTSANARFPGNATILYLSARVSDALDDPKAAEDGYKRAIAADPTIADAYLYLSRLYVRFRRYGDARPTLENGLEKDPKNAALHVGMGELAYNERNFELAGKEFKAAAEFNPLAAEAYIGLSKVALDQGAPDVALTNVEKALELNPRIKGGRLQKGMSLWRLQRLPEAVTELEQARVEEPRNTQVVVTLGAVEFERGQNANALNHLLSALQAEPSHPDGNFYMARVKNAARDHGQAIEAIRRALESDAKNPLYRYWFGRILADAKKTDEAIAEFNAALELNPKYADVLEAMGRVYVDRGQLKDAIAAFNKVLELDPTRNTTRAALGDAYTKVDDFPGATRVYTEAIRNDPDNPNLRYAYARLANAYREQGPKHYKDAVAWYEKATTVDPSNGEAFKDLGYLLKELKRKKEAIESWKKYLAVTTDDEKVKKVVEDDMGDLVAEGK